MGISTDEEEVFARILARVDRSALVKQCATAFTAEVRDVCQRLQQAQEALRALRELESAARYLRDQRRVGGVAAITGGALLNSCEEVVALNSRVAEALDRAVGGPKAAAVDAVATKTSSGDVLQADWSQVSADITKEAPVEVTTGSRKRKLSDASTSEGSVESDGDTKAQKSTCIPEQANEDVKPTLASVPPCKPTIAVGASVAFDPSESPIELPVPESDESDSESKHTASRSSCLKSVQQLQRATAPSQLSRFPALTQQLQSYIQAHKRDLSNSNKAQQEFVEAIGVAIRMGMELQFLPSIQVALASLLVTVEKLEQVIDPLPSPLNQDVEKLSVYFLRMARPRTDQGGDKKGGDGC